MVVISLHVPTPLAEELERLVKEAGYTSKSEAIREAIRLLIREHRKKVRGGVAT